MKQCLCAFSCSSSSFSALGGSLPQVIFGFNVTRVMAMRFNDMRVLSAKINNKDAGLARMITKLQGTELRHDLEGLAIDIMGEVGLAYEDNPYLRDHGSWQSQYMFFLGLIIGGGTSQIQKNIISERGLGLPREPKIAAN